MRWHESRLELLPLKILKSSDAAGHSEKSGHGHAVEVSRRTGGGGVDVGMGVDPEHGEVLAEDFEGAGDGADGVGMVSAQDEGPAAFLKGFGDDFLKLG